jgi:hypothetical protein
MEVEDLGLVEALAADDADELRRGHEREAGRVAAEDAARAEREGRRDEGEDDDGRGDLEDAVGGGGRGPEVERRGGQDAGREG